MDCSNREYKANELEEIEKYASIFLPISDIALILDIPAEQLREDIKNRQTLVSQAYLRGKASSKVKLHMQEMQLAMVEFFLDVFCGRMEGESWLSFTGVKHVDLLLLSVLDKIDHDTKNLEGNL